MAAGKTATVRFDDGASTTVELWGSAGPLLLCIHGIGSSRKSWTRTAEFLAKSYRVCAYDQRGHGDAASVHGSMAHQRSVADCLAVIDALGEPVHALIGHSWGGAIALLAGREATPGSVVAIDPLIRQPRGRWYHDYVNELAPLLGSPVEGRPAAIRSMFHSLPPVEIDAKVHALGRMSIVPVIRLGEENGADGGAWDIRVTLRRYPVPVLVMLADPDESVVNAEDRFIIDETIGPNGTVVQFDGEGHALHRTAFERYAEALAAFLTR